MYSQKNKIRKIYLTLLTKYGPQGWWPIITMSRKPGFNERGYHKGNYSYPKADNQILEVCLGAILTQNTTWKNAEKALRNLIDEGYLDKKKLKKIPTEKLAKMIKPSGYYNQKARKIKEFISKAEFSLIKELPTKEAREYLLSLYGIGKETADSILLYAFHKSIFVVDAYTKRIHKRIFGKETEEYDDLREVYEEELKTEKEKNEMHALLVEHAKRHCKKKPECKGCPLRKICKNKKVQEE